jgi:hypothetical protein
MLAISFLDKINVPFYSNIHHFFWGKHTSFIIYLKYINYLKYVKKLFHTFSQINLKLCLDVYNFKVMLVLRLSSRSYIQAHTQHSYIFSSHNLNQRLRKFKLLILVNVWYEPFNIHSWLTCILWEASCIFQLFILRNFKDLYYCLSTTW